MNQLFENGDLLITGNYLENLGPTKTDNGANTTDIFLARSNQNFNLTHFDEPVNSIFNEADANMTKDRNTILFVSDRPGHIGDYHKKGWLWNESYWGNTDIYVSTNNGDAWSNPINLGAAINTTLDDTHLQISGQHLIWASVSELDGLFSYNLFMAPIGIVQTEDLK